MSSFSYNLLLVHQLVTEKKVVTNASGKPCIVSLLPQYKILKIALEESKWILKCIAHHQTH